MKKKLVIFDFDDVIVNTHDISLELNRKTNPHLTHDLYKQMSHGNFYASFESVQFVPNPEFRERYQEQIIHVTPPVGIREVLHSLHERYIISIVSSAHSDSIKLYLHAQGLLSFFQDILGAETERSKVVKLRQLIQKYNAKLQEAVFITDTLGDVMEAHEVGIKSIAETWGLHDRETLERGKPEVIIESPEKLEQAIEMVLNS